MPVIEYKLIKTKEGNEVPQFVKDGGNWYNSSDFTMLGWLDPEPRKYWVPDTILELDRNGVIQRALKMHASNPMADPDQHPSNFEDSATDVIYLDSAGVDSAIGKWYDTFVSNNS